MHDANHGTDRHDEVGRDTIPSLIRSSTRIGPRTALWLLLYPGSRDDIDDFDRKPVARLDPFDFERTAGTRAARRCHIRIGNHTGL